MMSRWMPRRIKGVPAVSSSHSAPVKCMTSYHQDCQRSAQTSARTCAASRATSSTSVTSAPAGQLSADQTICICTTSTPCSPAGAAFRPARHFAYTMYLRNDLRTGRGARHSRRDGRRGRRCRRPARSGTRCGARPIRTPRRRSISAIDTTRACAIRPASPDRPSPRRRLGPMLRVKHLAIHFL